MIHQRIEQLLRNAFGSGLCTTIFALKNWPNNEIQKNEV